MPIVSLLLSHALAHSFISLLLERAVSLPVSRTVVFLSLPLRAVPFLRSPSPLRPAVIGVPNRNPSFRDRDASIVVLETRCRDAIEPRRTSPADFGRRTIHARGRRVTNNNRAVAYFEFGERGRTHERDATLSAHVRASSRRMRATKN